jgi:uncharacterized protein with NRDE domain
MCFILALFQVRPDYPLIVAANREESRARPSLAPFRWPGDPTVWAGKDGVAGGTWLGVNSVGMLAAITNRRSAVADLSLPSRGQLCLEIVRQRSIALARRRVEKVLSTSPQNPFNLFCASPREGWVATWRGKLRALQPGVQLVTSRGEPNARNLVVVRRALELLEQIDLTYRRA